MILVTGGTGFLGSQLIAELTRRGERVRVLCRSQPTTPLGPAAQVEIARGDVTVPESLAPALAGIRRLYHVAGRVDFNPRAAGRRELEQVNVTGTHHVLAAAKQARVERIVHVSSVSSLGAATGPHAPLAEEDFGRGLGLDIPYPRSKHAGELVALRFAAEGLPVVIVNPTFFAGPGDVNLSSARTIVSFLNRQLWVGLTTGGFGYTDVRDVVAGLIAGMEKGQPGRRYILGGANLTLREYHELLSQLTGLRAPRLRIPWQAAIGLSYVGRWYYAVQGKKIFVAAGDIRLARHYWMYRYDRARDELGLRCRSPAESLRDALAWLTAAGRSVPPLR